jgi:hypothetical protein
MVIFAANKLDKTTVATQVSSVNGMANLNSVFMDQMTAIG